MRPNAKKRITLSIRMLRILHTVPVKENNNNNNQHPKPSAWAVSQHESEKEKKRTRTSGLYPLVNRLIKF